MMTKTEQALKTFDRFITDWTPPAMHEQLFGHKANAADSVRRAILGIVDQRALALRPGPFGYAVFAEKPIASCYDYRNGVVYEPVSPIFERPCESVLDGWQRRRTGIFVHGEIREYEPLKRRK